MDLVKCPFCGKEIEKDSFYCDQCSEELKVCPAGHGFKKGKVCSECGTKLVEARNAADSPAPQGVPAPGLQQTPPAQTGMPGAQQAPSAPQAGMPTPNQQAPSMPGSSTPVQPSPSAVQSAAPTPVQPSSTVSQADVPEKTSRPVAAPVEPKELVSPALNVTLGLKDGAIIGRRAGDYTHVFGTQGYVSGTHARIQKNGAGVWEIVDLDSSNGTFLNGQRLAPNQPAAMKIGDTVAFYDLKFTVR